LLGLFPKTYFLTGERDPLVDDTVIFAGRLRKVKEALYEQRHGSKGAAPNEDEERDNQESGFNEKDVAEVTLIPGISHGFLQFPTVYPPAWKLMERAAGWIEEAFASAATIREREARRRRRTLVGSRVNGISGSQRHQMQTESSGDEDKPLEMSMTRLNRGRASPQTEGQKSQTGDEARREEEQRARGGVNGRKTANGKAKHGPAVKSQSIVKLNSSDDLLGRRMQGLASGLTGLGEAE
jgi:hypothetical protein